MEVEAKVLSLSPTLTNEPLTQSNFSNFLYLVKFLFIMRMKLRIVLLIKKAKISVDEDKVVHNPYYVVFPSEEEGLVKVIEQCKEGLYNST